MYRYTISDSNSGFAGYGVGIDERSALLDYAATRSEKITEANWHSLGFDRVALELSGVFYVANWPRRFNTDKRKCGSPLCESPALDGATYCAIHRGYIESDWLPGSLGHEKR
jgi:hypothetical protein